MKLEGMVQEVVVWNWFDIFQRIEEDQIMQSE
jgi:hypothetical protein